MIPFPDLVNRVIQQESGGNPNAVNASSGASGLMQVMPATAASPGFGVAPLPWDQRFDAEANRRFGTDYLNAMLNRYDGDQARALVAYNWGPGNADKWSGDMAALPDETRNYVASIMGMENVPNHAGAPAGAPQDSLTQAMASPPQEEAPDKLSQFAGYFNQPVPQAQAPQIQRGPGYVKQHDSLARALEAFNQTRQNRR